MYQQRLEREARLLCFQETASGPEQYPEQQKSVEDQESLETPTDVKNAVIRRSATAEEGMQQVKKQLTSPSVDILLTRGQEAVDYALEKAMDLAVYVDGVLKEDAPLSENKEVAPETPNELLWKEFEQFGTALGNARLEQLEKGFMELEPARAEAMLKVHQEMFIEDRALFDKIIQSNATLLSKFSDNGFNAAVKMLSAGSVDGRSAIMKTLTNEDRELIATIWSPEHSEKVGEYYAQVDNLLRSPSEGAGESIANQEEPPQDMRAEAEKIQNPALKSMMLGLIDLFYSEAVPAVPAESVAKKEAKKTVDSQLKDLEGESKTEAMATLTKRTTLQKEVAERGLQITELDIEAAAKKEPPDEQALATLKEKKTALEQAIQQHEATLAYLKALDADQTDNAVDIQRTVEGLRADLPEKDRAFTVEVREGQAYFVLDETQLADSLWAGMLKDGKEFVLNAKLVQKIRDA